MPNTLRFILFSAALLLTHASFPPLLKMVVWATVLPLGFYLVIGLYHCKCHHGTCPFCQS